MITLSDAMPAHGLVAPGRRRAGVPSSSRSTSRTPTRWHRRALDAGATEINPVADHVHGDRAGSLRDPFGHRWATATHIEDVSPAEIEQRFAESA